MDNTSFNSILSDNLMLHEDMLSLLRAASEDKKKKDTEVKRHIAAEQPKTQLAPVNTTKTAPDVMDSNFDKLEPIEDSSLISSDDNNTVSSTNGSKLYNDISPQVMIANSIIAAIYNSFINNCDNKKKMNDYFDQVKSWEKQARGACQQVMSIVESNNFDTTDTANCSPKAYKTIVNYDSRDRSAVDLCAAIIIFRNSLKKD